jgi:hypothetical protein
MAEETHSTTAQEEKKKKGSILGTVGRAIGRGAKRTAGAAKKAVLTDPRVKRVREVFKDTPATTTTTPQPKGPLTKEKIEAARKKPVSRRRKIIGGAARGVGGALRTRETGREMVGDVIPKIAGTAGTPLATASERTIQELNRPFKRKATRTTRRSTRSSSRR